MNTSKIILSPLPLLRMLRITGRDRVNFLQGQLTQDVSLSQPGGAHLYGWTTAQGRLLVVGQLLNWSDALLLSAPASLAETVLKRMRLFVLRAEVRVEISDLELFGMMAPSTIGAEQISALNGVLREGQGCVNRLAGDPSRALLIAQPGVSLGFPPEMVHQKTDTGSAWALADIRAGIPDIGPEFADTFIPQMVNLDLLQGVSFDKGCYSGQEIITRTRHLGRIKRRMLRYVAGAGGTIRAGSEIFAGDREVGQVLSCVETEGGVELLAVVQLDAVSTPLFLDPAGVRALKRQPLPYPIPELANAA